MSDQPVMLITGASSGIGAAIATQAAEAGYALALNGRSADPLEKLAASLSTEVIIQAGDVTDEDDQRELLRAVTERFGRLDVTVANAGLGGGGGFRDGDPDRWQAMALTNVYGTALTIHVTLPLLLASKGHVVLTGSVTGRVTTPASVYSATKWAVTEIGQSLRAELQGTGVRVTTVQPGVVDTPFYGTGGDTDNAALAQGDQVLKPDDVARTVLWALSQPAHVDISELVVRSVTDQL